MENEKEKFEFQAETKQLLNLMINSIYTNHEIFLRELISNASDAIDKLRFASLTHSELLEGDSEFVIRLTPDEKAKTLTITDNGIGMTKEKNSWPSWKRLTRLRKRQRKKPARKRRPTLPPKT